MNKKVPNFIIVSFLILSVCIGSYSFARICLCYDEEEAKDHCAFKEEYLYSKFKKNSGRCFGPSCMGEVTVFCYDFDAKAKYHKTYASWDSYCNDCFR